MSKPSTVSNHSRSSTGCVKAPICKQPFSYAVFSPRVTYIIRLKRFSQSGDAVPGLQCRFAVHFRRIRKLLVWCLNWPSRGWVLAHLDLTKPVASGSKAFAAALGCTLQLAKESGVTCALANRSQPSRLHAAMAQSHGDLPYAWPILLSTTDPISRCCVS